MSQEAFVEQNLGQDAQAKMLWINRDLREQLKKDLSDNFSGARTRYWQVISENTDQLVENNSPAMKRIWVLEYIGRDRPITLGFVIGNGVVEKMEVLAFRESRGYEIKYPNFKQQLKKIKLDETYHLSHAIDNITGATLSVNAVKKAARMALYLDRFVSEQDSQ